jgi:hypothetical protein
MKQYSSYLKELMRSIFLLLALCLWVNMGETGRENQNTSKTEEPRFAPLEEGEGSYSGIIYDGEITTKVIDLSFSGKTNIGGIRNEADDSFSQLKFSDVKEIDIVNPKYSSKNHSNNDEKIIFFSLITVKTNNGKEVTNLLAPPYIVVCGIEQETKIEKAWFLYKINKIVITGQTESKSVKTETVKVKKEIITSPSKKEFEITETKKETIEEKSSGVKKKVEKEAKELSKNETVINLFITKASQEEKLLQQERMPRTIWDAFTNILDSVINFFKVILHKFLAIFGY